MLLTLERHRRLYDVGIRVRVWLDDCDVTLDCVTADNAQGYVVLLRRDQAGRRIVNRCGQLVPRLALGRVRFVTPRGDLPLRWSPLLWFTFPRASLS